VEAASSAGSTEKLTGSQQRLVERHLYLVAKIAGGLRRGRPAHLHSELGAIVRHGLVVAAVAFDPSTGQPFEGFAWLRIRGFVSHELRRRSIAANDIADDDRGGEGAEVDGANAVMTGAASRRASQGPEAALANRRDRAHTLGALADARGALDPRTREVLRLRYDEDLEWREVALRLGISQPTARRLHTAALERLGRRLRACGVMNGDCSPESELE